MFRIARPVVLPVAIIVEATLSFVGLGIPPTQPSLGTLIRIGNGYLFSGEWWIAIVPGLALVILVLSISLSFVVTCTLYYRAHGVYARLKDLLHRIERVDPLVEDVLDQPDSAEILIIGTGRIGSGAYRALHRELGDRVWGMDVNRELIARQLEEGMHVFVGDGENADLWDKLDVSRLKLVLIATPVRADCRNVAE